VLNIASSSSHKVGRLGWPVSVSAFKSFKRTSKQSSFWNYMRLRDWRWTSVFQLCIYDNGSEQSGDVAVVKFFILWLVVKSPPTIENPINTKMYNLCTILYHHNHHWQNSHFWATAYLSRFCQIWSGFHFFGFRYNNFCLQSKVVIIVCIYNIYYSKDINII
jgi:hypothetical protein